MVMTSRAITRTATKSNGEVLGEVNGPRLNTGVKFHISLSAEIL